MLDLVAAVCVSKSDACPHQQHSVSKVQAVAEGGRLSVMAFCAPTILKHEACQEQKVLGHNGHVIRCLVVPDKCVPR